MVVEVASGCVGLGTGLVKLNLLVRGFFQHSFQIVLHSVPEALGMKNRHMTETTSLEKCPFVQCLWYPHPSISCPTPPTSNVSATVSLTHSQVLPMQSRATQEANVTMSAG